MIRTVAVTSAILLATFATTQMASSQPQRPASGLSPQDVASGFNTAVIDGCVAAAESGRTIEQLASDKIVRDSSRGALRPPKPGSAAWAPRLGQGIVTIDEEQGSCDVSAYGPPVESTFAGIIGALREKGYEPQPMPRAAPKSFEHHLKMTAGGRTVTVMLIGNEPGAPGMMSRFSGLSAFVSVKAP